MGDQQLLFIYVYYVWRRRYGLGSDIELKFLQFFCKIPSNYAVINMILPNCMC
jgi:hypothetical protein